MKKLLIGLFAFALCMGMNSCAKENKEAAEKAMKLSFKLMDSAVNKGTIHHNTADRKKSRMNIKFNKMA